MMTFRETRYLICLLALTAFLIHPSFTPKAFASKIVAVVNGAVVTDYDISQRQKLERLLSGGKRRLGRSATLAILVDDKLKLFEARARNSTASDSEVSGAMNNMARNVGMSRKQMINVVNRAGIATKTMEGWMKTRLSWQRVLRARFNAQVRIDDADITRALGKSSTKKGEVKTAFQYDLTSVNFVIRAKASKSEVNKRLKEAKRFRSSFKDCNADLKAARRLTDVAITRVGRRMSTDLPDEIDKELRATPLNGLSKPQRNKDGIEMLAMCGKKDLGTKETLRSAAKNELENKRGEELSRKYIRELRSKAVIEHR